MSQFVHLHVHSTFSLLSGASSPQELVAAAQARGLRALALTDTNGLYAAVPFCRAARAAGIKPILGAEIETARSRAVLLARDLGGYRQICRVITGRHLCDEFDLLRALLDGGTEHVFVLSSDERLLHALARQRLPNVYVELPIGEGPAGRGALASDLGLPAVATGDVHFHSPHLEPVHRVLTAIRLVKQMASLRREDVAPASAWLKPPELVERELAGFPRAVANAGLIAEACHVELPLGGFHFPEFQTADGRPPPTVLQELASSGLARRYPTVTAAMRARLGGELAVITSMGYASYFLTVWDIVRFARKQGIAWAGKGSAAASLVTYALGITDADPIRFDLYFERFLNPERKDPPDIDVDFCWRRRDEVIDYVLRRYGAARAAMICTYNRFGFRSALREVAKACGLSRGEIAALFQYHGDAARQKFEREEPARETPEQDTDRRSDPLAQEPFRSILGLARAIRRHPRHLSIHAGGVVIAPGRITDFVPLERSAKGVPITQFDMHPIEDVGLVKIDLLGQRSLAVIDDTVKAARAAHGIEIDPHDLPERDEEAAELMRRGLTIGCFQIESPGMRALLQKLRADTLPTLVAAESIIRPGPADSGMMRAYIRRSLGQEPPQYLHPMLEEILRDTHGVMLYQEDVLKVVQTIGGLSLGEADDLRRSMTKKRGYEGVAHARERFLSGARRQGFPAAVAEAIWRQVASFAGYAFCKAHSAAYSVLSYQAVYLKAHFPAAFLAAVLTNQGGFYDASVYVEEARRLGLAILPPDVNVAKRRFTAEGRAIRIGLMQVKALAGHTIDRLLHERSRRRFSSLADFVGRVPCSRRELENLVRCGAADGLEQCRPRSMWQLEALLSERHHERVAAGLFADNGAPLATPAGVRDYSLAQRLRHESDVLGFAVTAHPLAPTRASLHRRGVIHAIDLPQCEGQVVAVAGRVISSKHTTTEKGEDMLFLTLEDETAAFEVVFFPAAYRRLRQRIARGRGFLVTGKVQNDDGAYAVAAEKTEPLADAP